MFNLLRLYDERFDIIDLKISTDYTYDYSIEVDASLIIDIDTDKRIVSFEILDASEYFELNKELFYRLNWCIKIKVTDDVIKLYVTLTDDDEDNVYQYMFKVINHNNVIPGEYFYANSTGQKNK